MCRRDDFPPYDEPVRLHPDDRRAARGVHVRPSVDGRYWDAVNAAIADRDELLDAIREAVEAADWRSAPLAFQRLNDLLQEEVNP